MRWLLGAGPGLPRPGGRAGSPPSRVGAGPSWGRALECVQRCPSRRPDLSGMVLAQPLGVGGPRGLLACKEAPERSNDSGHSRPLMQVGASAPGPCVSDRHCGLPGPRDRGEGLLQPPFALVCLGRGGLQPLPLPLLGPRQGGSRERPSSSTLVAGALTWRRAWQAAGLWPLLGAALGGSGPSPVAVCRGLQDLLF